MTEMPIALLVISPEPEFVMIYLLRVRIAKINHTLISVLLVCPGAHLRILDELILCLRCDGNWRDIGFLEYAKISSWWIIFWFFDGIQAEFRTTCVLHPALCLPSWP